MKYYHIDAFTLENFKGNSAGVIICDSTDIEDTLKQSLASEFKHSETAFVYINDSGACNLVPVPASPKWGSHKYGAPKKS